MAIRDDIITAIAGTLDTIDDVSQEIAGAHVASRLESRIAGLEVTYPDHLTDVTEAGQYRTAAQNQLGSAVAELFETTTWRTAFMGAIADGILVATGAVTVGSGTIGKIPKWATTTTLTDSIMTESSGLISVGGALTTTGANTLSNLAGSGTRVVVASSTGLLSASSTLISGSATSGQATYWNGTNSLTGSSDFLFTDGGSGTATTLQIKNASNTASSDAIFLASTAGTSARNALIAFAGATGGYGIGYDSNRYLSISSCGTDGRSFTAGTKFITVDTSFQRVGIITSTPQYYFDLAYNVNALVTMAIRNPGGNAARLYVETDAGFDPYIYMNPLTGTGWSFGPDASDSSAFVFDTGTTLGSSTKLKITTAGAVTIANLAGTGSRVVVASTAGLLSASSALISGSGATPRVVFWSGANALSSDSAFTFGSSQLAAHTLLADTNIHLGGGSSGSRMRVYAGAAVDPTVPSSTFTNMEWIELYHDGNVGAIVVNKNGTGQNRTFDLRNANGTFLTAAPSGNLVTFPSGDVAVSRSNPSGVVKFSVINNTTAGNCPAQIYIATPGTPSGSDAFLTWDTPGIVTWSMGSDWSDNAALVVSMAGALGTTNVLRFDRFTQAATLQNLAGSGTRAVVADSTGLLSAASALITGSGTSSYIAYWNGTSTLTGVGDFTFVDGGSGTPTTMLVKNSSNTASSDSIIKVSTAGTTARNSMIMFTSNFSGAIAWGYDGSRFLHLRSCGLDGLSFNANSGYGGNYISVDLSLLRVGVFTNAPVYDFDVAVNINAAFTAAVRNSANKATFIVSGSGGSTLTIGPWSHGSISGNYLFDTGTTLGAATKLQITAAGAVSVLAGNLDVTRVQASGVVSLLASNASNTGSANAAVIARIAGSSGGDPVFVLDAAAGGTYGMGYDTSAGKFYIGYGVGTDGSSSPGTNSWFTSTGSRIGFGLGRNPDASYAVDIGTSNAGTSSVGIGNGSGSINLWVYAGGGGDAEIIMQSNSSSGLTWAIGPSTSNSEAFEINRASSLNNNTKLRISTAGIVSVLSNDFKVTRAAGSSIVQSFVINSSNSGGTGAVQIMDASASSLGVAGSTYISGTETWTVGGHYGTGFNIGNSAVVGASIMLKITTAGAVTLAGLAGTGTRYVTASSAGLLSTTASVAGGSGTAGQVAYWSGSSTLTSDSAFTYSGGALSVTQMTATGTAYIGSTAVLFTDVSAGLGFAYDNSSSNNTAGFTFSASVTKDNANTRQFFGMKLKPTLNTGGSNTTTTFNVFEVDTTNTGMTGLTTNLSKWSYGGTQRMLLDSGGRLNMLNGGYVSLWGLGDPDSTNKEVANIVMDTSNGLQIQTAKAGTGTYRDIVLHAGTGAIITVNASDSNIGLNGTSFGGGTGVIALADSAAAPTSNPSGGVIIFSDSGAAKVRGASGTVTTFGPADPHCPECGADFMHEFESDRYGYLAVCLKCAADEIGDRKWILRKKREAAHVH